MKQLPSSDELLLFVDAFDVAFCVPSEELYRLYHTSDLPKDSIIIGGETCCWPDESITPLLMKRLETSSTDNTVTHNPYPNSGVILGTVKAFQRVYDNDTTGDKYTYDDQLWWQYQYLTQESILLDTTCKFIQCYGPEGNDPSSKVEWQVQAHSNPGFRAYNCLHRTFPCIVHANGDGLVRAPWLEQYNSFVNQEPIKQTMIVTIINLPRRYERRDYMLFQTFPQMEKLHKDLFFIYLWIGTVDAAATPELLRDMKESSEWYQPPKRDEPCPFCEVDAGLDECFHFRHMKLGEFGCTASHIKTWNVAMHWGQYQANPVVPFVLILEDDATLQSDGTPVNFLLNANVCEVDCHYFACRIFTNAPGYRYWTCAYGVPFAVLPKFQALFAPALKEHSVPLDEAFCVLANTFPFADIGRRIRDTWKIDWVMSTSHSEPVRPFTQNVLDEIHDTETLDCSGPADWDALRYQLLNDGYVESPLGASESYIECSSWLHSLLFLHSVEASKEVFDKKARRVWFGMKPIVSGEGERMMLEMSNYEFEQKMHFEWNYRFSDLLEFAKHLCKLTEKHEIQSNEASKDPLVVQDNCMVNEKLANLVRADLSRQISDKSLINSAPHRQYVDSVFSTQRSMLTMSFNMLLNGGAGISGMIAAQLYESFFINKLRIILGTSEVFASSYVPERLVLNLQMYEGDIHGGHYDDDPYAMVWCILNVPRKNGGTTELWYDESCNSCVGKYHLEFNQGIIFRGDKLFHSVSPLKSNVSARLVFALAVQTGQDTPYCSRPTVEALYL